MYYIRNSLTKNACNYESRIKNQVNEILREIYILAKDVLIHWVLKFYKKFSIIHVG